ncbi:MAG TPA: hypothetical protein VHC19_04620 [Pirellulales bacterium]|nr:hypothetical protein [Pirellulales bacterium]
MSSRPALIAAAVFVACMGSQSSVTAAGRVELELVMDANFPVTTQQEWYRLLTELKVDNLRIRKAISGDKAEIKVGGTQTSPVYRVTGILRASGQLVVPGGKFSSRDRGQLAEWLTKLREEGPERVQAGDKLPFGLTPSQFAAVNADLSQKVDFSTKNLEVQKAVARIAARLQLPLSVDRLAAPDLQRAEPVREDLQGISSGTSLAYLLRSAGLTMAPRLDARKRPEYVIAKGASNPTPWPVGWPADKPARELLPELFEQLNVEFDNVPLTDALTAVGGRLKSPVLYDHYALARNGIDLEKAVVALPPSRLAYAIILRKVLHQVDLKGEWRIDETGAPLLWVTTLKPVK